MQLCEAARFGEVVNENLRQVVNCEAEVVWMI